MALRQVASAAHVSARTDHGRALGGDEFRPGDASHADRAAAAVAERVRVRLAASTCRRRGGDVGSFAWRPVRATWRR